MKAVIDENLPRSFSTLLEELGFTVYDVRDHGLRGHADSEVYKFAQDKKAVLFSADLGFSQIISFPLGSHFGICILRFSSQLPVAQVNSAVKDLLKKIKDTDYPGNLIILSPGKLRIRKPLQ